MQRRAITGIDFEKEIQNKGWVKNTKSPRLKWKVSGKSFLDKLKTINYDPSLLILDEGSSFNKYDVYDPIENIFCEVKKYKKEYFQNWVLYSEPYFKIASKSSRKKISTEKYNNFVNKFYSLNSKTNFFNDIINKMNSTTKGVLTLDGLILIKDLEFRTIVVENSWGGYYRITIQCRLKTNL